jgi:hypothetical protein
VDFSLSITSELKTQCGFQSEYHQRAKNTMWISV